MDFIYGASLSEGGLPIIALPSTTTLKDGTIISRIVPMLKPEQVWRILQSCSLHRHRIWNGDLYGKTIRQRTCGIDIDCPSDFRDDLTAQAKQLNYI